MTLNAENHENKLIPSGFREWSVSRDGVIITTCDDRDHAELILNALDALDGMPETNEYIEGLRDQIEALQERAGSRLNTRAALRAAFG